MLALRACPVAHDCLQSDRKAPMFHACKQTRTELAQKPLPQVLNPQSGIALDMDWCWRAVAGKHLCGSSRASCRWACPHAASVVKKKNHQRPRGCAAPSAGIDLNDRYRAMTLPARGTACAPRPVSRCTRLLDALWHVADHRGAVCVYHEMSPPPKQHWKAPASRLRPCPPVFPPRLSPFSSCAFARASKMSVPVRRPPRIRHRYFTPPFSYRRLAALIDECVPSRRMRWDAHVQSDPLQPEEFGQPAATSPRVRSLICMQMAGGGFHQDLDRQGKRQCDPARDPS